MNLVGKILVILIFLMSIAFMAFSCTVYSTHRNWAELINKKDTGYKARLDAEQKRNQDLQLQLTALNNKANELEAARRQSLAKLESERDQLTKERETLLASNTELNTKNASLTTEVTGKLDDVKTKLDQVASLRGDVATAQAERDENLKKFVEEQDKANQQEFEKRRLEALSTRLAEQAAKSRILLDRAGMNPDSPVDGQPPSIDGVVLASNRDLVEISLGSDMGLSRGNQLDVARGAKYVGRIEVIETQPDRAVGRVLPTYQKAKIQKDDRVYTRLQ
ncbi:MAG: hypothetical protein JSS27_17075 [Planctomycetes bacterium]|nr:hypothetical protein [Planctomycetota bacterium]